MNEEDKAWVMNYVEQQLQKRVVAYALHRTGPPPPLCTQCKGHGHVDSEGRPASGHHYEMGSPVPICPRCAGSGEEPKESP